MSNQKTPFSKIYDNFLSRITEDMYMELSELDTFRLLEELLISAVPKFEFPRVDLTNYETSFIDNVGFYTGIESDYYRVPAILYDGGYFAIDLTQEEINILAVYMVVEWIGQQLASVEVTRMKYSGSDFKFTSQANHMSKLLLLKKEYEREGFHLQRLYKRRKPDINGIMRSTFGSIMEPTNFIFPKKIVATNTDCCCSEALGEIEEKVEQNAYDIDITQNFVEDALSWGQIGDSLEEKET